jgi:predicted RNA methylase
MSEIKVDTLTGKTSAGDITVTSEGGAATMQLQQGLAKAWIDFTSAASFTLNGSFNISSLSDIGAGYGAFSFAASMADANYAQSSIGDNTAYHTYFLTSQKATSGTRNVKANQSHADTDSTHNVVIHGDLA